MTENSESGIGIFILILRDIIEIECTLFRALNFVKWTNYIYIEEFKMQNEIDLSITINFLLYPKHIYMYIN